MSDIEKNKNGFAALITVIFLSGLILIVAFSLTEIIITKRKIVKNQVSSAQSYYSAESGIEDGLLRVIKGYDYDAVNTFSLGDASIDQNVTQDGDITTIESFSLYKNNKRKVRTSLTITTDTISFHYGVQVGQGGLEMANNSSIIGNIYSNGNIVGNLVTSIMGDIYVATGMSLDYSWTVYNSDRFFAEKGSSVIDVAQSFKLAESKTLSQVSFYIKKRGNPNDGTIRVVTDDGTGGSNPGSPTKTELGSTTLSASKIGEDYSWVDFSFSTPVNLTANQWYWIVIDTSINNGNNIYYSIGKDSNNGNGNGVSKYSDNWNAASPVWFGESGDFDFKIWLGGLSTSVSDVAMIEGDAYAHTITNSKICGDAYYQTIDSNSQTFVNAPANPPCDTITNGTLHPDSADPAVEALPISEGNIADWETDASCGGACIYSDAAHCQPANGAIIGPAKLECDFAPPSENSVITIAGTVWIRGNISLPNNSAFQLASDYGTNSGVIIADYPGSANISGIINLSNNVKICGSSGYDSVTKDCNTSNGSYLMLLSTHNGAANAITVSNNGNGVIFYASQGSIYALQGAKLKEATGYKLELENGATVTYESGLANASFTSGPGAGWQISNWNEIE